MKTAAPLPIRLRIDQRAPLEAHFLSLGSDDRRLRFGSTLADESVREYVARIDFDRDEIFAVTGDDLSHLGVVHIAFSEGAAELGMSVLPHVRGQGIGNALFERAVMHLRNRDVGSVFVHCLAENQAMMHLARKHDMRIVYSGGESEARLALDPPTAESFVTEWLRDQRAHAAETMKSNAHFTRRFMSWFVPGSFAGVKPKRIGSNPEAWDRAI